MSPLTNVWTVQEAWMNCWKQKRSFFNPPQRNLWQKSYNFEEMLEQKKETSLPYMYKLLPEAVESPEAGLCSDKILLLIVSQYVFNFDFTKKIYRKQSKLGNCFFYRFAFNFCWCTGEFQQVIFNGNFHVSNSTDKF